MNIEGKKLYNTTLTVSYRDALTQSSSFRRKPESSLFEGLWTPAFAGVTGFRTFYEVFIVGLGYLHLPGITRDVRYCIKCRRHPCPSNQTSSGRLGDWKKGVIFMTGNTNLWVDKPTGLPRTSLKRYESFLTFITAEVSRPYPAKEGD